MESGRFRVDLYNSYKMTLTGNVCSQIGCKLLLSAKSSYIIIMKGPSSDFGSQPYFGYL